MIAVPKPVDVLPAAVERTPLRVVVFQEVEPGETAVRAGIVIAVVDRVCGEPGGDSPQTGQQIDKLIRRHMLQHLI